MNSIFSVYFWKAATERALKTGAQFVIGAGVLGEGVNLFSVDLALLGGFAATGIILSYLTSVASAGIGGSPSLLRSTPSDR